MDSDDGGGGGGLEKRETRNGRGWGRGWSLERGKMERERKDCAW